MSRTYDLSITLDVSEINSDIRTFSIVASDNERAALLERFKIVGLKHLSATVSVTNVPDQEAILISGAIKSDLTQQCIISLEDVEEQIDEHFELLLVSPEIADQLDEDEAYLDPHHPDYDSFEGDRVHVGEVVAQTLSVMMNPYPKHPDAVLKGGSSAAVTVNQELEKKPNPFAVLSKLNNES